MHLSFYEAHIHSIHILCPWKFHIKKKKDGCTSKKKGLKKKQNGCKDTIWIIFFQKHTVARLLASNFFLFPQIEKR